MSLQLSFYELEEGGFACKKLDLFQVCCSEIKIFTNVCIPSSWNFQMYSTSLGFVEVQLYPVCHYVSLSDLYFGLGCVLSWTSLIYCIFSNILDSIVFFIDILITYFCLIEKLLGSFLSFCQLGEGREDMWTFTIQVLNSKNLGEPSFCTLEALGR